MKTKNKHFYRSPENGHHLSFCVQPTVKRFLFVVYFTDRLKMLIIMKHYFSPFAQSRSFEQNPATPALLSSLSASCAIFLAAFCALTSSIYSSRPAERSGEDVDIIMARLKNVKAFERFHPSLLHQICLCGFYECLEKGITREPPDCFSSKSNICCSE